jgi:photosystem II stability/assembly factor-like uncharacterized protein
MSVLVGEASASFDGDPQRCVEGGLDGAQICWLDMADGQNGAALDQGSALFLTRDGGKTWKPADFSAR